MKFSQILLGRHHLNDASYQNPDMVIREQGSCRHRLSGASCRNPNMMISERGQDRHHISDVLHRRPDIVSNEQESSHLTRDCVG
jgi:hypothetical protein